MNRLLIFLMLGMAYAQSLTGCPTCIGRLELQSPAFFSDELYQLDPEDDIDPSTLIQANGLGTGHPEALEGRRTSAGNDVTDKNAGEDDEDDVHRYSVTSPGCYTLTRLYRVVWSQGHMSYMVAFLP